MFKFSISTISLGCSKHHQGEVQMGKTTKNTMALRKDGKIASLRILCHCKYSMKEYSTKTHLHFNMCDSGAHHCLRYTGELTSHLCWAWLAGIGNMCRGYFNNDREEPLLTLTQYLLRSLSYHHITSHHGFSTSVWNKKQYLKIWLTHINQLITLLYHITLSY